MQQPQTGTTQVANRFVPAPGAPFAFQIPQPQQQEGASLWVGDLDPKVNESDLYTVFAEFGIMGVKIVRDHATHKSKGYGYVNLSSPEQAERAVEAKHNEKIAGRPVRVMKQQRNHRAQREQKGNLYLSSLHEDVKEEDIKVTFAEFGNILSTRVPVGTDGKCLGYGYVHFENIEDANKAVEMANGQEVYGKKIYVTHYKSRGEREEEASQKKKQFTNVYLKNLKVGTTEAALLKIASSYGKVVEREGRVYVAVKTHAVDGQELPYAFVNFTTHEAAQKFVEALHDTENAELADKGSKLYVQPAMRKSDRIREFKRAKEHNKALNNTVFVNHVDSSITEEDLVKHFESCGPVTSVKLPKKKDGERKSYAIVTFNTKEEMQNAISTKNGTKVTEDTNSLEVKLYQSQSQLSEANRKVPRGPGNNMMMPMNFPMMAPQFQHPFALMQFMQQQQQQFLRQQQMMGGMPQQQMGMGPQRNRAFYGGRQGNMRPGQQPQRGQQHMRMQPMPQQPMGAPMGQPQVQGQIPQQQPQQPQLQGQVQPQQPQQQQPSAESLASTLASMSRQEQRNFIGEKLYPLIEAIDATRAPKITGMLLDTDATNLLHLLDDQDALRRRVDEARHILESGAQQQQQQQQPQA